MIVRFLMRFAIYKIAGVGGNVISKEIYTDIEFCDQHIRHIIHRFEKPLNMKNL